MKPTFKVVAACMLAIAAGLTQAGKKIRPNDGPKGTWAYLGQVSASHSADHDRITISGRNDDFRKLKFRVKDAGLNLHRVVVTYDNGPPETLNVREDIPKGGESRAIDLRGARASLRTIEFWYDSKGLFNGKADVTVFGQR